MQKYGGLDYPVGLAVKALALDRKHARAFLRGVSGGEEQHWEAPGHVRSLTRQDCPCCQAWRAGRRVRRAYGWGASRVG